MSENPALEGLTRGRVRRKVASSAKAKSEVLKLKRAAKSGDGAAADALDAINQKHRHRIAKSTRIKSSNASERLYAAGLESKFLKLDDDWNVYYKNCTTKPFKRPIDDNASLFLPEFLQGNGENRKPLTCPKRPEWDTTMSQKEVHVNEERSFGVWLNRTDEMLKAECPQSSFSEPLKGEPTYFERNLTVWRQLWRVSELADILMILLDARCPPLHYPPSLKDYVRSIKPRKKIVLVLTKCDLVGSTVAMQWKRFLELQEEEECDEGNRAKVVCLQNYVTKAKGENEQGLGALAPGSSSAQRRTLVDTLRSAHDEIGEPDDHGDTVDWKRLAEAESQDLAFSDLSESEGAKSSRLAASKQEKSAKLRIGIIGQPNVGKSSLVNALLGRKVVSASSTPGHTKVLQTINWSDQVQLIDCPGLTCPTYCTLRLQVLASIVPIQNAEAVISYLCDLVPFEDLLRVERPRDADERPPMILTGRNGAKTVRTFEFQWTADALLQSYALYKGYVNAKAGRPDVARAGATIIRLLQQSNIPWAFRPITAEDWPDSQGLHLLLSEQERRYDDIEDDRSQTGRGTASESEDTSTLASDSDVSESESEAISTTPFTALTINSTED